MVPIGTDGNMWMEISEASGLDEDSVKLLKIFLLRGIYDGVFLGGDSGTDRYYTETSLETLITALDEFYADSANLKIPVAVALWAISAELKGLSKEKVYSLMSVFRETLSDRIVPEVPSGR